MKESVANVLAESVEDAFESTGFLNAWVDVHGKNEAELVVEVDYGETTKRMIVDNENQATVLLHIINASKEQGLEEASEVIHETL